MSEGDFYNIEKILDRRKTNGKIEYKIKWEGYPMSQSTWEPMKNLESAKELVEEYDRTHPITAQQKSSKSEHKKKETTFINKKRKEENDDKIQQIPQNEKLVEEVEKKNNEDSKINTNENEFEKTYTIDDSLKSVITVKQQNQKLIAVVDKLDPNGDVVKTFIPTEELRKSNPWILLNFYESKIKFT